MENLSQIMTGLNIAALVILALGLLIGFIRGFFKSAFNSIAYILLLLIGCFVSAPIAKALLPIDLSSLNIALEGVQLVSVAES